MATIPWIRWLAAMAMALTAVGVRAQLTANDVGLVINSADPYSVAVGEHYIRARVLADEQVLRVELPVRGTLTPDEFETFAARVRAHFSGDRVQALALAWQQPYAVACLSITGALALGIDAADCSHTCAPTRPSAYFNSPAKRPATELGWRPSMLLAAHSVEEAVALIDRGVGADRTLGRPDSPKVEALLLRTDDGSRNVRAALFPAPQTIEALQLTIAHAHLGESVAREGIVMLHTGVARLPPLSALHFVPGALADHLTSAGGRLGEAGSQSDALEWIAAGATASYGTVSEPCNHLQKFPHPQVLLRHYVQGASAIEAYWKSVAWPAQGVFVGEPLAAPFAR